ncbi:MAG: aspartate aminotransferase family protein [Candidatus Melainabacteria bacterium]
MSGTETTYTDKHAFLAEGIERSLDYLKTWEAYMPGLDWDETQHVDAARFDAVWKEFTERLSENYPFFHALYAAQMVKPPHPVAEIGYLTGMMFNPNNHALEGGPPTTRMEKECIELFAQQFGFTNAVGHLTGGGTMANLEALWMARELHPEQPIAIADNAHYTHRRMARLLRCETVSVNATPDGVMDVDDLKHQLLKHRQAGQPIGTVVVTLGTTSLGVLDPLDQVLALQKEFGFRVHVDMAYGGYFHCLAESDPAMAVFRHVQHVDSLVIDPHKQGLQPYGCGCVLFNNPDRTQHLAAYHHDSPYTYFLDDELHLGEISLECSRPGAAAAALWLTLQLFPLSNPPHPLPPSPLAGEGELPPPRIMAELLKKQRQAALDLASALDDSGLYQTYVPPALDIVTYFPKGASTQTISDHTQGVFRIAMHSRDYPLFLATLKVDADDFVARFPGVKKDSDTVTILRSTMMKPEHAGWVGRMMQVLLHNVALTSP